MNFWTIIDIMLVAVILIYTVRCASNGFVSSAISIVGTIAAIIVAILLSKLLAGVVYDLFIKERLVSVLTEKLDNIANGASASSQLLSGFVGLLIRAVDQSAVIADSLVNLVTSDSASTAEMIVDHNLSGTVISIIRALLFLILYPILRLIVHALRKITDKIKDIPLVGSLNSLLGGVLGVAQGLAVCSIVVFIFSFALGLSGKRDVILSPEAMSKSYVFSFFYDNNPIENVLSVDTKGNN